MFICERTAPVSHHFLGGPLGGRHEGHGGRAAQPGDGVGVLERGGCLLGQLGVLVDDDHQRGHPLGWFPFAPAVVGEVLGAGVQDGDRVGEQRGGLVRGGGEPVEARGPGLELHAAFEVDGPDDHVAARGEVGDQLVEPAAFARAGRAADDGVPAQEQHPARFGVLERSQVDRLGDRGDRRAGPRDRVGVRVAVQHAQFTAVGEVIGGRVDADRVAVGAQPRFDRGDLGHHVGDGLAACQPEPGAPAPQVHRGAA